MTSIHIYAYLYERNPETKLLCFDNSHQTYLYSLNIFYLKLPSTHFRKLFLHYYLFAGWRTSCSRKWNVFHRNICKNCTECQWAFLWNRYLSFTLFMVDGNNSTISFVPMHGTSFILYVLQIAQSGILLYYWACMNPLCSKYANFEVSTFFFPIFFFLVNWICKLRLFAHFLCAAKKLAIACPPNPSGINLNNERQEIRGKLFCCLGWKS